MLRRINIFYTLGSFVLSISLLGGLPLLCFAQRQENEKVPLRFDEYILDFRNWTEEEARLARFAKQLKREPSANAYIIAYTPRLLNVYGSGYWHVAENRCLTTKAELTHRYGVKEHRLICIDGGVREKAMLELWILPHGASPPNPKPEFQAGDIVHCYPVRVSGDGYVLKRNSPLKFSAAFSLGRPPRQVTYQWTVSSGRIIDGQGQETITVDVSEVTEKEVTAEVEIKGLSAECQVKASYTTVVGVAPYKLSEFEENYSEALQANLDNLAVMLQREPELEGYIVVYGGRVGRRGHARSRGERAKYYLTNMRGLQSDRFTVIEGGYRERLMFEIWLIPRNGQKPVPTPSVDPHYVSFVGSSTRRKKLR
jgi:hypothetical protein